MDYFIIMHSLRELAHNRPIIPMEHFLKQVAWLEAQLPLVRPDEAAPAEPTTTRVKPKPADPQSLVVNPPFSPKLEVVLPSPPLIIISDSLSRETIAPPDSPAREAVDPPDSPIGKAIDLSYSSSREAVALSDSPVFLSDR
ncbi:hypothetical protein JHK84_034289 [Glycine max]|nr:hypothetical protein JHK85_034662 [Glycine max]KAG4986340.1 hypothetical protein JHK86_034031 [Glycine max]KAG5140521.1 hypothetical protein JHK84_034289 [Glycine max]